jgi:hypothetical protein
MTFPEEPNQPKQTQKEGEHVRSILLAMLLKSQSSPHDLVLAKDRRPSILPLPGHRLVLNGHGRGSTHRSNSAIESKIPKIKRPFGLLISYGRICFAGI